MAILVFLKIIVLAENLYAVKKNFEYLWAEGSFTNTIKKKLAGDVTAFLEFHLIL